MGEFKVGDRVRFKDSVYGDEGTGTVDDVRGVGSYPLVVVTDSPRPDDSTYGSFHARELELLVKAGDRVRVKEGNRYYATPGVCTIQSVELRDGDVRVACYGANTEPSDDVQIAHVGDLELVGPVMGGVDVVEDVAPSTTLEHAARKAKPLARGCLDYFPAALLAVAELSRIGNEQHNPGEPMHHARAKSSDHADCILRHLIDRGTPDTDGISHSVKVAWRALALLQEELEAAGAPLARGAKL